MWGTGPHISIIFNLIKKIIKYRISIFILKSIINAFLYK